MTKARARQRAKKKAARKAEQPNAKGERPGQDIKPGQFDPGANSIKSPRVKPNANTFAGARRGAARSR